MAASCAAILASTSAACVSDLFARLQFARDQSIGWIGSIILPEGAIGSVASRFEVRPRASRT